MVLVCLLPIAHFALVCDYYYYHCVILSYKFLLERFVVLVTADVVVVVGLVPSFWNSILLYTTHNLIPTSRILPGVTPS